MHVPRPTAVVLLALLAACSSKSANPLSPSIAGPIAGVTIEPPKPVAPAVGTRLARGTGAVTLTVENAVTTGQRPLTYAFEGSTDATFATGVFRQSDVPQGANGRTSVVVASTLAAGRTYYWRAIASDGANASPYSDTAHFAVYEPFTLAAPTPLSPAGGSTLTTVQPLLRARNADRSGEPGTVRYEFQVALSDTFAPTAFAATVPEGDSTTEVLVTPLTAGTRYHWRVRGVATSLTSAWSATESFVTQASAPPPPQPPPPPNIPPSNPGPRPSPSEGLRMVEAVIADLHARGISMSGDCGAFEITRRVAWNFRNRGAGLERKPGGRNCRGHSIDIVIFTDGQTVDMLIGAGVDNGPVWQEHGVLSDWADWWIAPTNPD